LLFRFFWKLGTLNEEIVCYQTNLCHFYAFSNTKPLLGYVVIPTLFPSLGEDALFTTACVVTGLVLFFMGCVKSFFLKMLWYRSGMETLLLG
jgi:vacuolar iron transporter family protein